MMLVSGNVLSCLGYFPVISRHHNGFRFSMLYASLTRDIRKMILADGGVKWETV